MQGGILIPVLPYTVLNFSQLVNPSTEEIILADRIPIDRFAMIGLSLRQHKKTIAAGGSFTFSLRPINPSNEDGADFVHGTNIGATSAITGTGGAALLEFNGGLQANRSHPMGRLVVSVAGSTAAGFLYGVFSADLVCRESA